ncbi:MAG: ATP-binding protein [Sulfitobacter sp.]
MHDAKRGTADLVRLDGGYLPPFDLSVQSSDGATREALRGILTCLDPLALDIEEISTVELVLAEALNNIVEHAYPTKQPHRPIRIACTHLRDGLHISISDEGNAMPDGQMPIGMARDVDVDLMDLPEGGFGWFLIRDLAKDVRYRREGLENKLDLRLAVAVRRAG